MMAEKCTNTSSPVWRWINPKPLLALNHFTVPCSLFTSRFSFRKSYLMLRLPNLIERGCGCPWSAFPVRSAGTKKGRKLVEHLATASRLQRRYKSNKRRYSIAQSCQSVQHILAAHSNALMSTVRGAIRASGGSWVNDLLLVL